MLQILLDLALGAMLGFLGGLFGIGGGIIAIPVLSLVFGMDQHLAQGTTLVMVVPNVMLGLWRYYKRSGLNVRYAIVLGSSAIAVTYLAARFAIGLRAQTLRMAFAVFIIAVAAYLIWQIARKRAKQRRDRIPANVISPAAEKHPAPGWAIFVGAAGGILSGMFGVGGATIAPPMLTTFYGFSQAGAQGLALALVAPGSVVGLATYARAGVVDWPQGLALAAGGMLFVSRGVTLAHKLSNDVLKLWFAGLLVICAGMLIIASR